MKLQSNNENKNIDSNLRASERKLYARSDVIVIAVLLVVALVVYISMRMFGGSADVYCDIYLNGDVVEKVALKPDRTFSIDEKPNVVFEVKDGSIAFIHSDCPDKVCIHSGFLHIVGQTAACLPNMMSIKIQSNDEANDIDVVI